MLIRATDFHKKMKSFYYQFDTTGRTIAMATTRSNEYASVNLNTLLAEGETLCDCNILALDITQWIYDETTGLLAQKLYADGNGPSYTYTSSGKLHTRTWARGKTTTYTYGDLGQITNVDYSDSTPDVTYTHGRLGRILSATSSTSTSTFHYNGLTLDYETQNGYIIKRKQDVLGREIGYELYNPADLVNPCQIVQYGYDVFNRLNTVTSIIGAETNVFTYTYLPGTDLVSGMSSDAGIQWSRHYETERDLITAITNSVGSVPSVVSSFDYINDPLGRRTKRTDYFNSSTITNDFIYNQNSEVIGATMNGDDYSYNFDPIGNRLQSTVDSDQSSVTNLYAANQLNQYTSVSSTGSVRTLSHDDDGNLTWDGQKWHHTYDGENRLIKSEPHSATNGSVMFEYRLNHKNLRVEKIKKKLSGRSPSYPFDPSGAGTWNTLETRRYIWDAWNITAEVIIDHTGSATNISYYTWGLDLSSTLQAAGGVGGLLSDTKTTSSGTNIYFAIGDANGNITEYMDTIGAIKAHYKYNSAGEITYQSGTLADGFTHCFSTKPFDTDTKLVSYEQRYCKPSFAIWLSRDLIEEGGGLNLYGFVYNNAVNKWDRLGLETFNSITAKRKHIKWLTLLKQRLGKKTNEDTYGHWWIEFDNESYGWWPKDGVDLIDTLVGAPGELNGVTFFGGKSNRDPHHGDTADDQFHPRRRKKGVLEAGEIVGGITCKCAKEEEIKQCLRAFAIVYNGSWSYPWGQNCHSYQKAAMKACCLKK